MAAPLKPWEVSMTGSLPNTTTYISNTNTNRLHSSAIPFPGTGGGGMTANAHPVGVMPPAPPPPPRPGQTRPIYSAYNRTSMMPYSNNFGGYSPYGMTGMGSNYYSPYSNYGATSYGMGPYGPRYGQQGEQSFSQIAEESASSAFQSIESFVSAFGSISAMLDSTFHALYSSFRAVIGVADHLGRVKQILSALSIFRFFRWVIRRFLYLVGISKIKPEDVESLWNNLSTDTDRLSGDSAEFVLGSGQPKPSSWPIFMFLGFIFAGPYLMWKLIKSLNLDPSNKEQSRKWATGEAEHFIATAEYQFEPMSDRELELKCGQTIRLAPAKFQPSDVKGWVLASDGLKIGLVPTNYIKIKGRKRKNSQPYRLTHLQSTTIPASPERSKSVSVIVTAPDNNDTSSTENYSSQAQMDTAGSVSDDDTETLVGEGEPLGE